MALGRKLANGVAIYQDFHHRVALWIEVLGVPFGQLNPGEQSVVEGSRHQAGFLLFHLGEQGSRAALENAQNPTFGGTAASPLAGHFHQHPVAIPGVVELVVADVNVLAAILPQGKAKALARAPQPGGNQLRVFPALDAGFNFLHHPNFDQAIHADPQLLLLGFLA